MRRLLPLALLAFVLSGSAPAHGAACSAVASPGADLSTFMNGLRPGDVGCLHAGTYGARETRVWWAVSGTPSARITLQGYPGEARPTILGAFTFEGDYLTGSRLLFDGPSGRAGGDHAITVWISGDHDELDQSEVRDSESQGIYLDGAENVLLTRNYIHDNGDKDDPAVSNLHHGIYFARGSGVIAGNAIVRNYSFGVHLYPSPHDVLVQGNVIAGHGKAGVIVGSEPPAPMPARNLVVGNLLASNGQKPVTSYGPLGLGNGVGGNVYWANGTLGDTAGLEIGANLTQDPLSLSPTERWSSVGALLALGPR